MVKTHLPTLDGLRGVAALAVVGSHFENLSGINLHLQAAGAAVDFFFILSGFVIAQGNRGRLPCGLGAGESDEVGQAIDVLGAFDAEAVSEEAIE